MNRIEFEGRDLPDPTLLIVFDKARNFDAKQGDDFRSLLVLIPIEKKPAVTKLSKPSGKTGTAATPSAEKAGQLPSVTPERKPGMLSPQREQALLDEGKLVMVEGDYARAVQVYTRLLDSTNRQTQETAQFQLALAQENVGHLAHARAEYKNYLRTFPEGPNREEARDRLKNLLSAKPIRLGAPGDTISRGESLWENEFYGSISVYYDRDESYYEDEEDDEEDEKITNINSLTTGFDGTWRLSNGRYTFETVAIGSYENDYLDEGENETRSSALYFDVENVNETLNFRAGRQSSSKGGVLGRFDGARFGYALFEKVRFNMVAGYPVERSSDGLETDKYFYGINFDLGRFYDHWDFNIYAIDQINDGIDDRRAVGGEIRYIGGRGSFFTLLDYDILYDELGIFLFAGNYLFPNDKTRINISADYRSSPILSTSNALIGQTSPTLQALVDSLGEDAVRQLARDRSLESSFITLGVSHPLTDNVQFATDVSWSRLDGAPASGGVDALESTGDEYYYSLQLIGNSIFESGDLSTLSLRFADTKQRDTYTLIINTRYPLNDRWRINPKLQIDYRENKVLTGDQWRYRPALRLEYLFTKNWRFEVEGEYSYADKELDGLAEDREGYSFSLGFRWDF